MTWHPLIVLYLLAVHLSGDFLLQNHWMQAKSRSSFVCTVHVLIYSLGFLALWGDGLFPLWAVVAIVVQHWLQDRFGLHLKWMAFYRQTTPDLWPVGPLCMDQSMHLVFIAFVCTLIPHFNTF